MDKIGRNGLANTPWIASMVSECGHQGDHDIATKSTILKVSDTA
jgi:hypothetical protein